MEGAISAYKFDIANDENNPSNFLENKSNWVVLKDVDCYGTSLPPERPAPTLDACIEQCYGLI